MAGAGQPFYMPLFWPFGNIRDAVKRSEQETPSPPRTAPRVDLWGHASIVFAAVRCLLLAHCAIDFFPYFASTEEQHRIYPAFGPATTFAWTWMWPIIVRNLLATWLICGFWDWFLYFSPLKDKLHKFKINPVYPSFNQIRHDAFWTTTASLMAAGVEILLCHVWATTPETRIDDWAARPLRHFLLGITITHWRIPHFYLTHRMMHPWRMKGIPDVGKFLYRHIHSLHHKSYNPTAFSGTNMHPIESGLYYSAAFLPLCFGPCHPAIALGCIVDCGMGAWLGHDGFQWPGAGDYFHMLHHKHFDCNYGTSLVPLDLLFGTYAGSKEDIRAIWGKSKAGEEVNETPVHLPSKNENKVE